MSNVATIWNPGAGASTVKATRDAFLVKQGWTEEILARYDLTVCQASTEGFWHPRYRAQLQGLDYIAIPFYGLDGDALETYPTRAGYAIPYMRVRLANYIGKGKYQSYPESGVRLYLPRDSERPDFWMETAFNDQVPIMITEGELDSIAAHLHGIACIGITGKDCFKDKRGALAAPGGDILWRGRKVYICFDQDVESTVDQPFSPGVHGALQRLMVHVSALGATVEVCYITETEVGRARIGAKVGLSEYFKYGGSREALLATARPMDETPDATLAQYLVNYAMHYGSVIDLRTGVGYRFDRWASQHANIFVQTGEKLLPVATVWPRHRQARRIERFVFEPREEFGLIPGTEDFNVWRGWETIPERGVVGGEAVDAFEQWSGVMWGDDWPWVRGLLAHLFLHPEVLRPHALVLQTPLKGIGKSTWFKLLRMLVGNGLGVEYSQDRYLSRFNLTLDGKMIVQMDEVYFYKPAEARKLIQHITSDTLMVEDKGASEIAKPWRGVFCLTTNEPFAVKITEGERRFMQSSPDLPKSGSELSDVDEWRGTLTEVILPLLLAETQAGEQARMEVMGYLMQEKWLEDYDPTKPAPHTRSLVESAVSARSEREALAYEVFEALPDLFVLEASMYRHYKETGFDKYVYDRVRLMAKSRAGHVIKIGNRMVRVLVCHKTRLLPTREDTRGVEVLATNAYLDSDITAADLREAHAAVVNVLGGL